MPTIVAIATGKKTISAQMTTLLDEPRAEPERRAAARGRGSGSPGRRRGTARRAARTGRCGRARSRRRARAPPRRRSRATTSTIVVTEMRPDGAVEPGLDEAARPTVSGARQDERRAGRRRRRPPSRRGRRRRSAPTTGSQTERLTRRAPRDSVASGVASAAPGGSASGSPRWARISRAVRDDGRLRRDRRSSAAAAGRPRCRRRRGPGRGDRTTTRSATRIASGMLWVTMHDRRRGAVPEAQQLEVEALAGERVERAERLVEEEDRRARARAPGRARRAGASRPTARLGGRSATAGSRPTRSISVARRAARRSAGQPASSSG